MATVEQLGRMRAFVERIAALEQVTNAHTGVLVWRDKEFRWTYVHLTDASAVTWAREIQAAAREALEEVPREQP